MKTIKPYYDDLLKLYCSCVGCEDKMIVSVEKKFYDNDDPFCFEIQYSDPANLWQKIKRAWRYIRGWKEPELTYDCILLNSEQVEELSKVLYRRVKAYRKKMGTYYKGPKEKEVIKNA